MSASERNCSNCRFCIQLPSMRGKEESYCKWHRKWVGDTILCSKYEPFNNLSKPFSTKEMRGDGQ